MESPDGVSEGKRSSIRDDIEMERRKRRRSQTCPTDSSASSKEGSGTDTDNEDEDDEGDQLQADDSGQPSTVLSQPGDVKPNIRVVNENGLVADKCHPRSSGSSLKISVTHDTDKKLTSMKRHSQSPDAFSNKTDTSDKVDDMDLEDLVIRDECSSAEEEEELVPRRRCFSETNIPCDLHSATIERTHSASPYNYKRPDPIICAESIEIECLMQHAHFFLARSCHENIRIAKERSFWTTNRRVEQSLGDSFMKAPAVILIFIEKGADHFAGSECTSAPVRLEDDAVFTGFAKMCSKALYRGQPALCWKEFNGGGNIKLQWISRCSLPIAATKHLRNSLNHGKEVYAGVDGSKIQRTTGQRLCSLFPIDETIDLSTLRATKGKKRTHKRGYPLKRRRKSDLPSLLDKPISFTQFKRARRNLTAEERWETRAFNFMYSSAFPYKAHSGHKMSFEDTLRYELYRPMPLMDLAFEYPLSASRRPPRSRKEYDRERNRMRHTRHHSSVPRARSHRSSSSRISSHARRDSQERRTTERKRHAERTPPRRRKSSRKITAVEKHHRRSRSSSRLTERGRERRQDGRHGSARRSTKRRRDSSTRRY